MKKSLQKNYSLSRFLRLGAVIGVLALSMLLAPTLAAQEESTDQENGNETTDSLRERIEQIVEQQKDNVQSAIGEITHQKQGFVGQVIRVSEETVTLESQGTTRVVPLDETVTLLEGSTAIEPNDIEIDDWAVVLGLLQEDIFTARRITLSSTSPRPDPHVVHLGTLKEIKARSLDFQPRGKEEVITADLNSNTEYQDSDGEAANLSDFVEDDQVLLIGYTADEETIVTVIQALAPFTKDE